MSFFINILFSSIYLNNFLDYFIILLFYVILVLNRLTANKKYYVYKLIDTRNGNVFYVRKGKGNRIFDNVNGFLAKNELEDW